MPGQVCMKVHVKIDAFLTMHVHASAAAVSMSAGAYCHSCTKVYVPKHAQSLSRSLHHPLCTNKCCIVQACLTTIAGAKLRNLNQKHQPEFMPANSMRACNGIESDAAQLQLHKATPEDGGKAQTTSTQQPVASINCQAVKRTTYHTFSTKGSHNLTHIIKMVML